MAKRRLPPFQQRSAAALTPEARLQTFLQQKKYSQAIDELKRLQKTQPDLVLSVEESHLWMQRGIHELEEQRLKEAEGSLRRSLTLGQVGEAHYWLARCLLELNREDDALNLIRPLFENGSLPKDYRICYLKLLLLKGEIAAVEDLINGKKSKQFSAAQLHWARGALAAQRGEFAAALESFEKVKSPRPLTPGDSLPAWKVYCQQQQEEWNLTAPKLGIWPGMGVPLLAKHPMMVKLKLYQQVETGDPPLNPRDLTLKEMGLQEAVRAVAIAQLIERGDAHNAAHALLRDDAPLKLPFNLGKSSSHFPELETLRPALLLAAGQQAMQEGELSCTEQFFQPLTTDKAFQEPAFNPQVAIALASVLEATDSHQERNRLLTRLIRWVERDAKAKPEAWPEAKLKRTIAHLRCQMADSWMALERPRQAMDEFRQAEKLDAQSPEVIGRKGLLVMLDGNHAEAAALMTQALEQGCKSDQVYAGLLDTYEELGDRAAKSEARRKFGKQFGDLEADREELPDWVAALAAQNFLLLESIVENSEEGHPATQALQIFVDAVNGDPTISSGRVPIDQAQATQAWDKLLSQLSGVELVETLEAIALCIVLYAKRDKGIAKLSTTYMLKISDLKPDPVATEAHLIVLAVKENNADRLRFPLERYLAQQPQPGNAVAQLQFKIRRFGTIFGMRPLIEAALSREPQNPLLLLAKATTYATGSQPYEEFREAGFELARRLQDPKALQAFRNEQTFVEDRQLQGTLPTARQLENLSPGDMGGMMDDMIENMIRQMMGNKVPKQELERMMPQLKAMFMNEMASNFGGLPVFGNPFGGGPAFGSSPFDLFGEPEEPDFDTVFGIRPARKKGRRKRSR